MQLVWFQQNFRLHDNRGIQLAERNDEDWVGLITLPFNSSWMEEPLWSEKKKQWWLEAAQAFKETVEERGGTVIIRVGGVEEVLRVAKRIEPSRIITGFLPGCDERRQLRALQKNFGGGVVTHHDSWLWHPEDAPFEVRETPTVFGAFRKAVEKKSAVRGLADTEIVRGAQLGIESDDIVFEALEHDTRSSIPFRSSEDAATTHLEEYMKEGLPKKYKYTRNQLQGKDFSTKFSVWLSTGALSPKMAYHAVERFEENHGSSKSTYWIKFELTWRDFFRYLAVKHDELFFAENGYSGPNIPWEHDDALLSAFKAGKTGYPLVDAGIRELKATGFMSNRARQNVASFFTKNLHLDWRIGAAFFEKHLLDYDVASNYGNWLYVAGLGADSRKFRYFNVVGQAKKYDAADYVTSWVPALRGLQDKHVYEPWKITDSEETMYGFTYGEDYPRRIVDFDASVKKAKTWFS